MNTVYTEPSLLHYELVMKEAYPEDTELPEICRRETIEALYTLEGQIGIFSVNYINEFQKISITLRDAVTQLYNKQPTCKKITVFLKDLSTARNSHDLVAVADALYVCFFEKPCCNGVQ